MDAFDADVLIYAAAPDHPFGRQVRDVILHAADECIGSVLLLPELLVKPIRDSLDDETRQLESLVSRLTLLPVDDETARVAVALGAKYNLLAADAVHLATAAVAGADRFLTNSRADFRKSIVEVDIVYPDEL